MRKAVAEDAIVPVDFKAFQKQEAELLQVFRDSHETFDLQVSRGRLALAGWHEAVGDSQ
jgi:hypothetical protein